MSLTVIFANALLKISPIRMGPNVKELCKSENNLIVVIVIHIHVISNSNFQRCYHYYLSLVRCMETRVQMLRLFPKTIFGNLHDHVQ